MGYGSITEITHYCSNLKSLTLPYYITEKSLLELSTQCPLLKELNIPCIPKISTVQFATQCTHVLSCINSTSTPFAYNDSNEESSQYAMAIPYMTELQELKARSSYDHLLLPLISQYCLKLESFQINESSSATPTQVLQLAQNCQDLHTIILWNKNMFKDEFIIKLAKRCPNLQEFVLYKCTTISIAAVLHLVQQCKQLCKLVLPIDMILYNVTVLGVPVKVQRNIKNNTIEYTFSR